MAPTPIPYTSVYESFTVFDDAIQGALFCMIIICTPICIFTTVLRFVGSVKSHRRLQAEDYLALMALLFCLGFNSLEMWTLIRMNGVNVLGLSKLPYPIVVEILKVGYGLNYMFPMNQVFAKLSLLFLYHRLFGQNMTFRRMVYAVGSIQTAWGVAMLFTRIFPCTPIRHFWDRLTPGTCISAKALLAAPETVNTAVDFVMVGMAIWMVQKLQISTRNKRRLIVLFALGSLAGILGIVKIADSYESVGQDGLDAIWDVVQMTASIICCTTPLYKVLLPDMGFIRFIRSTILRGSGRKSSSAASASTVAGDPQKVHYLHPDGKRQQPLSPLARKERTEQSDLTMQYLQPFEHHRRASTHELNSWKIETGRSRGHERGDSGKEGQGSHGIHAQRRVEVDIV